MHELHTYDYEGMYAWQTMTVWETKILIGFISDRNLKLSCRFKDFHFYFYNYCTCTCMTMQWTRVLRSLIWHCKEIKFNTGIHAKLAFVWFFPSTGGSPVYSGGMGGSPGSGSQPHYWGYQASAGGGCYSQNLSPLNQPGETLTGPVHICSRYTTPAKCSRNKFSVHERSDCEHCEMFSVPLRSDLKSAHISVCAVWLIVYTMRNLWGHFNVHSPCW